MESYQFPSNYTVISRFFDKEDNSNNKTLLYVTDVANKR